MLMKSDSLGDRMKGYENITRNKLIPRMPVMMRIDGRAFHTFTKCNLIKSDSMPFSSKMHYMMSKATLALCDELQNVVFAYMQSDEISLFFRDWDKLTTQQWFDGNIQKMVSIGAATATSAFNRELISYLGLDDYLDLTIRQLPKFDARVWNLPKEEIVNYFIWRQQDWTRNSVQMLGHHYFSHSELHGKNVSNIQDMLMLQKQINWNDLPIYRKRGTAFYRDSNGTWVQDENMPILTKDRDYVGQWIEVNDDDE